MNYTLNCHPWVFPSYFLNCATKNTIKIKTYLGEVRFVFQFWTVQVFVPKSVLLCADLCYFVPICAILCYFVLFCANLWWFEPIGANLCQSVLFCANLCSLCLLCAYFVPSHLRGQKMHIISLNRNRPCHSPCILRRTHSFLSSHMHRFVDLAGLISIRNILDRNTRRTTRPIHRRNLQLWWCRRLYHQA
jgi:hypothetical protein